MPRTALTTLSALAAMAACSAPALAGIQQMPGYEGMRVYEATWAFAHQANFAAGDTRLTAVLSGPALSYTGRDFGFYSGNENYDLYFSDADGTLNANGSCLTIDGNCDGPWNCFNITEVAVRINGADQLASSVVRAVYGRAGSYTPGSAIYAADGNFGTTTAMGDTMGNYPDGRMSITLAFANVPAVPEPGSWALLLAGAGVVLRVGTRRRASPAQ
jgi:hypothetical protein